MVASDCKPQGCPSPRSKVALGGKADLADMGMMDGRGEDQ